MAKQLAFHIDQDRCTGCAACRIACQDKHDLTPTIAFRRIAEFAGGEWTEDDGAMRQDVFAYYTSIACNHCENPVCVTSCPTNALEKGDQGIVAIDASKCVGCRYCEWACPYGAPQFNADKGVMTKCDFCRDYLAKGDDPACVAACPTRALGYGELEDLRAEHGDLAGVAPLPDPSFTRPSLVITPHRHAKPVGSDLGSIVNPKEV